MNTKKRSTKLYMALSLLVLVMMGLVGCGSIEVGAVDANSPEGDVGEVKAIEVGIEPTPMPEKLTYANDFYGFKFDYPDTWTLKEEDHGVVLKKGTNRLGINYRWVNEDIHFGRTGFGGGTPIYSDKISFMGQIIPEYVVELEHLAKFVVYSDTSLVEIDDLAFEIVLEDLITNYMVLDLPEEIIAEAKTIMESFVRIEATGSPGDVAPTPETVVVHPVSPHPDWLLYSKPDYDFGFFYPPSMTVVEEPNLLKIGRDSVQLLIAFRRPDENVQIVEPMTLTGQYQPIEYIDFLGQELGVFLNLFDDRVKVVYFGEGPVEQDVGNLVFAIRLLDTSVSDIGTGAEIDNALIEEMTEIVKSFGRILSTGSPEVSIPTLEPTPTTPAPDTADWPVYENRDYGFAFLYPPYMSVVEEPNKVIVNHGTLQLTIAYRRADENIQLADIGELSGEFQPGDDTPFMGHTVATVLNLFDGKVRAVYLDGPGVELGEGTPLRFVISLVDTEGTEITKAQIDEMLQIFCCFGLASWND